MADHSLGLLVVDDNEGYRELYTLWFGSDHTVEVAVDGETGLEQLDGQVDIVFLDRDMPGLSGTDVAHEIAASKYDPHVVMVSSMAIDFEIVEVPIDDYLQKPVRESDLQSAIDRYRRQQSYRVALDEYFSLTSKLAAIESEKSDAELTGNDEYERLRARIDNKRAEVDEALVGATTDWEAVFRTCEVESPAGKEYPNA